MIECFTLTLQKYQPPSASFGLFQVVPAIKQILTLNLYIYKLYMQSTAFLEIQ